MTRMLSMFCSCLVVLALAIPGRAEEAASPFKGLALDTAVWQYRADVTSKTARAFLWIPSKAEKLRGLVIGQFNMCGAR